jgi:GNAT superfamily N-acetyltransferase
MTDSAPKADPRYLVQTTADQPNWRSAIDLADRSAFPEFMAHTDLRPFWDAVYREFPEYQLVLRDSETGRHAAHGNLVPFHWDGAPDSLPTSAAELATLALEQKQKEIHPTALSALQVVIDPGRQGRGLSKRMLVEMAGLASARGYRDLFAPIRPNWKERYPLISLTDYVTWNRDDGLPRDPWQRVHARLGAVPLGVVPRWLTTTASVDDWARWTGLSFPGSGPYFIPGALTPVDVDVLEGIGTYVEPHLWMHYQLEQARTEVRV